MVRGLEGIKVVEVGGAFAMPLAGMLMGSWGAEVIHVEPPGRGDLQRHLLAAGMAGWARPHEVNYIWLGFAVRKFMNNQKHQYISRLYQPVKSGV